MSSYRHPIAMLAGVLIAFILVKLLTVESLFIGGHDTFQYIEWSSALGGTEQNLQFFRPLLYLIVKWAHTASDWDPRTFKVLLLCTGAAGVSIYFAIVYKSTYSLLIAGIASVLVVVNQTFVVADNLGHITQIEFLFVSLFFASTIFHKQNCTSISFVLVVITALCIILVHEEKLILVLVTLFLFYNVREFMKCASTILAVVILVYIWLNSESTSDVLATAVSVGSSWNSPLYFVNNPINTFNEILISSDPLTACLVSISVLRLMLNLSTVGHSQVLNNLRDDYGLFLASLAYISVVGVAFSGIELSRTIGVVLPYMAIAPYQFFSRTFPRIIVFIIVLVSVVHNLMEFKIVYSFDYKDSGVFYEEAYNNLIGLPDYCEKVSQDPIYIDGRTKMWGSEPNYGLRSKVYFYECFK